MLNFPPHPVCEPSKTFHHPVCLLFLNEIQYILYLYQKKVKWTLIKSFIWFKPVELCCFIFCVKMSVRQSLTDRGSHHVKLSSPSCLLQQLFQIHPVCEPSETFHVFIFSPSRLSIFLFTRSKDTLQKYKRYVYCYGVLYYTMYLSLKKSVHLILSGQNLW